MATLGQVPPSATATTSTSTLVRVGIRDFKKLQGSKRVDVFEESLPHLLRAGLFFQRWMDVSLLGKASLGNSGFRSGGSDSRQSRMSGENRVDYLVEGEFIEISDSVIRVDITVTDVLRQFVVFRSTETLEDQKPVAPISQLADRMAAKLREETVLKRTGNRVVVEIGPFVKNLSDPGLGFLDASLPLTVAGNADKAESRANLVLRPILPGAASKDGELFDAQVTGSISLTDEILIIGGQYQERTGLNFPFEFSGPSTEPLKVMEGFSRKVWEILLARVAPAGGFRDDPVLFTNAPPDKYFVRGQEYEKEGEIDAALFFYSVALRKKPAYPEARLRVAEIYRERENYDLAENEYAQILKFNEKSAEARLGLGTLHSKRGNYNQAVRELERVLELAARNSTLEFDACLRLGDVYLLQNKPQESLAKYNRAAAINSKSPAPFLAQAKAHSSLKNWNGAIESLKKGLELLPGNDQIRNDLASAYISLGRDLYYKDEDQKALELFRQARDLKPPDIRWQAAAHRYAGLAIGWGLNKLDEALPDLQKAVEIQPNEEANHRFLGMAYRQLDKYEEAIKSLQRANELSPTYETNWELGFCYMMLNNYDAGIASAKKAIELETANAGGYVLLGAIYETKFVDEKKKDRNLANLAIENLEQAIAIDAKSEPAHRILGILYRHMERYDDAALYLQRAVEIRPNYWAYKELGEVLWALGKSEESVTALFEALRNDSSKRDARESIQAKVAQIKQPEKVVALFQSAIKRVPDFWLPYLMLGFVHLDRDEYELAIPMFEAAIARDTQNEWPERALGITLNLVADRDKDPAVRQKAIAHLNRALELEPTKYAYWQLGKIFFDLNETEKAKELLHKSVAMDPRYTTAYRALEDVYDKLNRRAEFAKFLETVVAKADHSKFFWARDWLGAYYSDLGNNEKTLEHASVAIAADPSAARPYALVASVQRANKDWADAIQNAKKAIEISPNYVSAQWILINSLLDQNLYPAAIMEIQAMLAKNPKSAFLHAMLGHSYRLAMDLSKAQSSAQEAVKLAPRYGYARWVLGETYFELKKYELAIETAKSAIELSPNDYSGYQLLRRAHEKLGTEKSAVEFLETRLAKDPKNVMLLSIIGFICQEHLKDYQKAYEMYRRTTEYYPDDASLKPNLAEASLTTGRYDEALKLVQGILDDPRESIQSKLSMRLLQVAAYLFRGEQARAFAELGVFRDEYKKVPADYNRSWMYEGFKSFVQAHAALKPAEKSLLTRMAELLEAPQEKAAAKLSEFEASFAEIFAGLKSASAMGKSGIP